MIQSEGIAIVGLGALFPRSGDLGDYWRNIADGVDCIEEVPDTHWSVEDYYDQDPSVPDKTYCKRGGFIPHTAFDPLEFGMPPNVLEVTDVLQLLSLVVAKQTLRDAGCPGPGWYDSSRTGVVLGVTSPMTLAEPLIARLQTPVLKEVARSCGLSAQDADELAAKYVKAFAPWQESSFPGVLGNVVAGRIANRFDLGGLNCTVDAACASSLAAVRMAVGELVSGRADLMITGGCDAQNAIMMYLCFSKTPAFSKLGDIRPFDESGDGTLIGEGIGMLALKRLADAERDGDRVYAVLRGVGSSSDGRYKSIYAPRVEGQVLALNRAYEEAGLSPDQVGLVECHGTGTPVGDLTELTALKHVYTQAGAQSQSIAVGSVKSQIGHTKGAAGAASMIKVALALHQKVLPPTIKLQRPRQELGLEESPFYVNTQATPWILDPARPSRVAALSSFGFGGTNFHCVLEEHDPAAHSLTIRHRVTRTHVWHGASVADLLVAIEAGPGLDSTEGGIPDANARLAIVADGEEELACLREKAAERLRAEPDIVEFELVEGAYFRRSAAVLGKVAALFAGQGSQYTGMGARTAMAVPPVRAAFDAAAVAVAGLAGPGAEARPLGRVVFPSPAFDSETRAAHEDWLRRTDYAQPAIGALSLGQFRYLRELGFAPEGALGHSFGELNALWAADSLTDAEFYRLSRARGVAMARLPAAGCDPGAMAAVPGGSGRTAELLAGHKGVVICNLNGPGQTVVGGGTRAVEDFIAACQAAGVRAQKLPVAAAFHTRHMAHAVSEFGHQLATVEIRNPRIRVYANHEAVEYGEDIETNRRGLAQQLVSPVVFGPRVEQMYADGYRLFVEFGPKTVLSGLVRRILAARPGVVVFSADPGPGRDGDRALKQLAARLAVLGLPLSGINRYTSPPASVPESKGMMVLLNGANYVPEDRHRAYREALEDGYTVNTKEVTDINPASGHQPQPVDGHAPAAVPSPGQERFAASAPAQPAEVAPVASGLAALAAEHLRMHGDYLAGQLNVAERISDLLNREAQGQPRDAVLAAITAITQHGVAIGHGHMQASEVLHSCIRRESSLPSQAFPLLNSANVSSSHVPAPVVPLAPTSPARSSPLPAPAAPAPQIVIPAASPALSVGDEVRQQLPEFGTPQPLAPPPSRSPIRLGPAQTGAPAAPSLPGQATIPVVRESGADGADTEALRTTLLGIVSDKTGYPVDMLDLSMDVEADLSIDSIKRVEIMSVLQEKFPAVGAASPQQLGELRRLEDIVGFLAGAEASSDPKADGGSGLVCLPARLHQLPPADLVRDAFGPAPAVLFSGDSSPLLGRLAARLRAAGWQVYDDSRLLDELDERAQLNLVVHTPKVPGNFDEAVAELESAMQLAGRVQDVLERTAESGLERAAFVVVTELDGSLGLGAAASPAAVLGGLAGLVKTLAIEAPTLMARIVDLSPELSPERGAELLLDELHDADLTLHQVAYGGPGMRRTVSLTRTGAGPDATADIPAGVVRARGELPGSGDLLVVTGGGRGITAACAVGLAERYRCGLLLLGRTPREAEPPWAQGVPDAELRMAIADWLRSQGERPLPREVEERYRRINGSRLVSNTLEAVSAVGGTAEYLAVDVADAQAVRKALKPYRDRITGLVHGAGVLADKLIKEKRPEDIQRVLAPKLAGLAAVLDAVETGHLRFVLLFSSVAGFFGNSGQADYAMANEALNRLACSLARELPAAVVASLNWGAWAGGMVTPQLKRFFADRGVPLISLEAGVALFVDRFGPHGRHGVVSVIGPAASLAWEDLSSSSADPVRKPRPGPPTAVTRRLGSVATDPLLSHHAIDGVPVLPATAVMGAMMHLAGRTSPGARVDGVDDFTVFRGVVFDENHPKELSFVASADGGNLRMDVRDEQGRPRYRGVVRLVREGDVPPAPPKLRALPPLELGDGAAVAEYPGGTLFHGPRLQGIRRILLDCPDRLVLGCLLEDLPLDHGAYGTADYSPVLADLLLQAPALWARRHHDLSCLPSTVGSARVIRRIPSGQPFYVVVQDISRRGSTFHCTVTACAPDGSPYLVFGKTQSVGSAALNERVLRSSRSHVEAR